MRYLLDGRPLQGASSVRGIGTYESSLLAEFAAMGIGNDVTLLLAAGQATPPQVRELGLEVAPVRLRVTHPTLQPIVDPLLVGRAVRRLHPALYHGIELGQPLGGPAAVAISVHDLIPFVFPRDYPWVRRARIPALRLLRRADRVLVPSTATERDVIRFARVDPSRIEVTPYAVASRFAPAAESDVAALRKRLQLPQRYLLAVGTFDPRKRVDLLAAVAARVCRDHDVGLVVAGEQGTFEMSVRAMLDGAGLAGRHRLLGHVPLDELVALYSGAECLVFTSAYEGFGLPPLEAMACGTPVALFDNSSLPEVAGPAALMVGDGQTSAMADAVAAVLTDPAERLRRRALGLEWVSRFRWRRTAEATLEAYQRAMEAKRSSLV